MKLSNIIGSGFIAKSFSHKNFFFKKKNCILYAAGVSNSKNKNKNSFKKDFNRLKLSKQIIGNNKIIYISSCSVLDKSRKNSLYLKKKIQNEIFIKKNFDKYLIVRLPEIIGKNKNKNTLVNYFYYNIKKNKKINLYKNAKRNFISIDDIVNILIELISKKKTNYVVNIASSKMTKVYRFLLILEKVLNKKAKIYLKSKQNKEFKISIKDIKNLKSIKKIKFDDNYLIKKLTTYKKF